MSSTIPRPRLDLIDLLLGEHSCLLSLFRHVEPRLPSMTIEEVHRCGEIIEALLMAHAIDEDQLLFHSLPAEQKSVKETLDAMFHEHSDQKRMCEELHETEDPAKARRRLAQLIEMTREHLAVEERNLFGLAKKVMSDDRLEELGEEFARRRGLSTTF